MVRKKKEIEDLKRGDPVTFRVPKDIGDDELAYLNASRKIEGNPYVSRLVLETIRQKVRENEMRIPLDRPLTAEEQRIFNIPEVKSIIKNMAMACLRDEPVQLGFIGNTPKREDSAMISDVTGYRPKNESSYDLLSDLEG
ncbi:hypothetical protein [Thermoactinomyces sp. DSM 45892]|uniref:hypothetical protein n=1 Tax=Thermoactinomyces sp. DSM 45892 TaxID=1882753 RepID=UPI00089D21AA|nr:hypothetical protein [Thermoactinomyces sp. DSM 45892]SDY85545.1 hypothetical protein SAMN05444416_10984 [Thermoactinomyces sp. DSM 45892]